VVRTLRPRVGLFALLVLAAMPGCAGNGVDRTSFEQSYLIAGDNWAFRKGFPGADRLLNAFDYGHAALYQTLLVHPDAAARLEGREFDYITTRLLRHPPNVPLDEVAIGPAYAALAPELVATFGWAHMLHRQLYDTWAAAGLTETQRDAEVARVLSYYRSRGDLALSTHPKSMTLMEGQPYSLAFRREAPKFNGLLWSYHWFQLALYDALIAGHTQQERRAGVDSVVRVFFGMLDAAPTRMPATMPMAPMSAPVFAARYPAAAIVFDNLHALHDVASDILASPLIPASKKRIALLAATAAYRDDTTAVTTIDEWRAMAHLMSRK
jgi:hypothetical protein